MNVQQKLIVYNAINKKRNDMNGEKVIDLLWEVKEGKKHPNKAYKELCVLFDVVQQSEQLICPKCKGDQVMIGKGDNKCAYTDCRHEWAK